MIFRISIERMGKIKILLGVGMCVALSGCAHFSDSQSALVSDAIKLQNEAIASPEFAEILASLDRTNKIKWEEPLIASANLEATSFPSKTAWLISKFANPGLFQTADVRPWRKWNPFSSTTATTTPGQPYTRLNLWRLKRTNISVANTLIHERVHSFGQKHANGQSKPGNECDAAYVAGDLAESLLLQRAGMQTEMLKTEACSALCADPVFKAKGLQCTPM